MTMAMKLESAGSPSSQIRGRVRRARSLSLQDRDRLLFDLVLGFRSGNRFLWAPLILDFMSTAIRIRVSRYRPEGPTITVGDVYQGLVWALLEDALSIPLTGPARLERRLLLRSADRVSRGLQREARYQKQFESLEAWAEKQESHDEHQEELQ